MTNLQKINLSGINLTSDCICILVLNLNSLKTLILYDNTHIKNNKRLFDKLKNKKQFKKTRLF